MSVSAVIIDDDVWAVRELKALLSQSLSGEVNIMAEFSDPSEALVFLQSNSPQLIFLDIKMPGMSGFDLLNQLDTSRFEVIFCTAYDQYAIQAIRYSALDYLLKPINTDDLIKAVMRFQERREKTLTSLKLQNLQDNLAGKSDDDVSLVIASKQGEHRFNLHEIVRCEADSNYTAIHLRNRKKFIASKTLGDIEEMLSPDHFIRIHKSHLVNLRHILGINAADELMMDDESRLPVSRRRLQEVRIRVRQ
jgi:two-component system LytT family response regulator